MTQPTTPIAAASTNTIIAPENASTLLAVTAIIAIASIVFNIALLGQIHTIVGATAAFEIHDAKFKVQQIQLAEDVRRIEAAIAAR